MLKAVIFDMDGLMFDTEALALKAWKYVGKNMGFEIKDEDIAKIRGVDTAHCKKTFESIYGEKFDFFEARSQMRAYMNEYVDENGVPVKPGLFELLDYIKGRGLKIALATSTENKTAIYYLSTANVLQYFTKIISGDMVEHGKPHPDIYNMAVKMLECTPDECIVLEDSPNGTMAAHRADCKVIMVPDLDKPTQKLSEFVCDYANNLNDVIEKLKTIE